jgi:hypothetical protein
VSRRRSAAGRRAWIPVRARAVLGAVRPVQYRLRPAEEEAGRPRIADRPSTTMLAQFEQRAALAARDTRVRARNLDMGLCACDPGRRRPFAEPIRGAMSAQEPIGGARLAGGASAGSPAVRRQTGDAEAMDLGDHRVGGDAMPHFRGDLAHSRALRPASPQQPQPRLCPWRGASPRRSRQADRLSQYHASRDSTCRCDLQMTTFRLFCQPPNVAEEGVV